MKHNLITIFCIIVFLLSTGFLHAKDSLAITVTPPLFQLTVGPGEFWSSDIKVVNTNSYDMDIYATVMNFEAKGEDGKGDFIPLVNEDINDEKKIGYSLGAWIEVPDGPVHIPSGKTGKVPFSVKVPENAEPGGHYAAILVGTNPPKESGKEGPSMKVASFVSSLLFVRIEGEVLEEGRVRQFSTKRSLYQVPEADFILRFENMGNVHLKPQGDIIIYNMWEKERGRVEINQKTNFGNVLPKSTRKFEFSWKGEENIFEIGRYSAVVTLSYGEEGKKTTFAKSYFWVIPIIPVAMTLGTIMLFILSIVWFIRRYIRRALSMETSFSKEHEFPAEGQVPNIQSLAMPIKQGMVDLRSINAQSPKEGEVSLEDISPEKHLTLFQFIKKYFLFFVFLAIVFVGSFMIFIYFDQVLIQERDFDISIKEEEGI